MKNEQSTMETAPDGVTYFQLRYLYRLLYGKALRKDAGPCILRRTDLISQEDNALSEKDPHLFLQLHPSYKRFLVHLAAGSVQLLSNDDPLIIDASEIPKNLLYVRSSLDFVKLHFYPLYYQWKDYIDTADRAADNLQDIMGRKQIEEGKRLLKRRSRDSNIGAGAQLKELLFHFILDNDASGLQLLINSQSNILVNYKYSSVELRESSMTFFKEARKNEDPENSFIRYGILDRIEELVMDLFSRCCDDAALTIMLISTVLRERMDNVLPVISSHPSLTTVSFTDSFTPVQLDLGNGYFIQSKRVTNHMGGCKLVDMTLYRKPFHFIRKVTDYLGIFFSKPQIENPEWDNYEIKRIDFFSDILPFHDDLALFIWELRQEGRYWEDDTGFGSNDEKQIVLYSLMNTSGELVVPFSSKKPAGW